MKYENDSEYREALNKVMVHRSNGNYATELDLAFDFCIIATNYAYNHS